MNKIKQILFHKQALLLIPILIFLRNSADLFYSYMLKENDLVTHSGRISFIGIQPPDSIKKGAKYESIKIKISSEPTVTYELPGANAPEVHRYFKSGDEITFYTEKRFALAFSKSSAETTIIKAIRDNKVIINHFKTYKKVSFNMMLFHLTLFSVFLFLYIYKTRKRMLNNDD